MKRIITNVLFFLIVISISMSISMASEADGMRKSLFFVIDVSGSMQKNDLFSRLKKEIKSYIKDESRKGDWVTIITFGTDIKVITSEYIREEKTLGDTNTLLRRIDNLTAREKYTYITGAIDILASQMKINQKANPDNIIKAFLFTDGKNDPPPSAEGADWTFEEIIKKHYDVFDNPSTYLYILTLGIEPDESLKEALKDKKRVYINEVPDIEKIEIPKEIPAKKQHIELEPEKLVEPQITIDISGPKKLTPGENIEYKLMFKITEANDEAEGKNVYLQVDIEPLVEFSLGKNKVAVKKDLKEKLPIILHSLKEGEYTVNISVSSDTIKSVTPKNFELKFRVKKFNPIPLIILGIIVIIAVLIFLSLRTIPKFPDDYVVVNTRENVEYELRDKQKFYSSSVSSEDLEILDVDFKMSISKKTGDVTAKVLIEGEEEEKILKSGDMIIEPYKFDIRMI